MGTILNKVQAHEDLKLEQQRSSALSSLLWSIKHAEEDNDTALISVITETLTNLMNCEHVSPLFL